MTKLCVFLISLFLVGCASKVKPEMTSDNYTKFAKGLLIVDFCSWKGWIDADTAALGKRYIQHDIGNYVTNFEVLNTEASRIRNSEPAPEQGECNRMAAAIKERQQNIVVHNQAVEYNQQTTQEFINSTKVRNTNCNRIGTQLLCNTY